MMFNWQKKAIFQCVAYSVTGRRETNEDNYLMIQHQLDHIQADYLHHGQPDSVALSKWRLDKLRIAVADGMGGHQNGQQASESLIRCLLHTPAAENVSQLAAHVKTVHKKLLENFAGTGKSRPGSTLIMADVDVITGVCVIANVGDSRAYLLRAGRLHQLSHDHSYCEFSWRDGDIKADEYFNNRQNPEHHLTQAMGFGSYGVVRTAEGTRPYQYNPNLRLDFKDDGHYWQAEWDKNPAQHRDVFLVQLEEDDVLLLASDGLWSTGSNSGWTPEMTQPLTDVSALYRLVQTALEQGSQDNISVVMCARIGATGGYNAIDSKTEWAYQRYKKRWQHCQQRFLQPLLSILKKQNVTRLKPSLFLAGLVLFWLTVALRITYLHFQPDVLTEQSSVQSSQPIEDQYLFNALKESTLLSTDAQKRLLLVPPDYDLARAAAGHALSKTEANLLAETYNSIAGRVVRRQIAIWNQTREFSALRDTREAKWDVTDAHGLRPDSSDTVPESFGFVHQTQLNAAYGYGRLRTEFGDWQAFQHRGSVVYQRSLAAGEKLTSQYIGHFQHCQFTVAGQTARDCKDAIQPLCKIGSGLAHLSACQFENASAGELRLARLPAAASVALTVAAVANPLDKVSGLAISYTCKATTCADNQVQNFSYQAEKTITVAHQDSADSSFSITTADDVALTDTVGLVNLQAEQWGLLGLIGTDKNDVGRLSYLMAKSHFPENTVLKLTLDSQMQQVAQQVLAEGIKALRANAYQPLRRGAIVVLDTETGDILASASVPQPPTGVDWHKKSWDKAVFSRRYYLLDPFLNRPWQGGDANQAPGSTFKVLLALAAAEKIQALKEDPAGQTLRDYFTGLNPAQFTQATGLKMADTQLPVFSSEYLRNGTPQYFINNFRSNGGSYETMGDFYHKPLSASACETEAVLKNRLGVAEALRDSSNVWFAQLAKWLDGEAAQYHDLQNPTGNLDLTLNRFLIRLGFADNLSLIGATDALTQKQQTLWSHAWLLKTPVKNENNLPPLLSSKTDAMMNLTQTAIGQSLYVTPLEMAQVATLAATGQWLKPNLITQWQADKAVVPLEKLALDANLLALIHTGMAAAVQVGTAEKAFAHHPDRCRVYGKTGTAQVGDGRKTLAPYNTAWFIGWREPKQGDKAEKKIAFACMVTHTPKTETGGSLCAPIMANFLTQLNQRQAKYRKDSKTDL